MDWNNAEIVTYVAEKGIEVIKRTSFRRGLAVGMAVAVVGLYLYNEFMPAKLKPAVKDVANG